MPASASLERFKIAQDSPYDGYEDALRQLRTGRKTGHWIWYVFPQIAGLGMSDTARLYAISGTDEAAQYLNDAKLRARLLSAVRAVTDQLKPGKTTLRALMASDIDAKKLVSSLTLFAAVARQLHGADEAKEIAALAVAAEDVLAIARAEGYPPCAHTLQRIRHS